MNRGVFGGAYPEVPLRRLVAKLERAALKDDAVVTVFRDGQATLRSVRRAEGYTLSESEAGYQGVEPGDLVIHGLDAFAGSIGVSDARGKCSPVYHVCSTRSGVDAHYVAYALRAEARAGYLAVQAGNVRQRSVDFRNWETLARIIVPLPDYAVQRELVDRLQRNLRQLNRIEQVYRELAVQAELRAAAMIAEIIDGPAIRLKHLVERVGSGKTPRGGAESYASSGVLFIRSTNVRRGYLDLTDAAYIDEEVDREMASSRVRPGDVLFNITGASIGRSTVAPSTLGPANVNQHVYLLRPNDGVSGVMLSAALNAPGVQGQIAVAQVGGNRDGLTSDQLGDIRLQWPRGEDASAAEASVVNIQSWVADMRFALVRQLDLLQERRQALITAAVTGQLEIPGVAA